MKKVLTVGVFDLFHLGHLRLFKRAKALGDHLIVAVQEDEYIKRFKPSAEIIYNTEQRAEVVESIKCVDEVTSYTTVDETVKSIDYDILVIGPDQNHEGFQKAIEYSRSMNKEVVILERTKDISSTELKQKVEKIFW